jgi:EAL domain-containing protein (putative c-di-GMP-specific phosphodiesterase class I)
MDTLENLLSTSERACIVDAEFDIDAVIRAQSLSSHFQPIISIRESRVIGLEALARATDPASGKTISPSDLFQAASHHKKKLPLEQLCRAASISGFKTVSSLDPDLILFLNLDVSLLDETAAGSNAIINLANEWEIPPERIAIEFIESKIRDERALQRFLKSHRKKGFLIALDDMGAGHSNLERIPSIKPDIIKIDRSLIEGINREYHKQELFDFFIKLAHKIGVMVVAEGIETEAEALCCLERGADLVQGFYFARPQPADESCLESGLGHARLLRTVLKDHMVSEFHKRKEKFREYNDIASRICAIVELSQPDQYEIMLENAIARFPSVECAYVIHESGRQMTRTVLNPKRAHRKRTALFGPAGPGGDQSTKDYFIYLDQHQRRFVTDPYVSIVSGNVCVTISNRVSHAPGESFVVCVDIELTDEFVPS